MAADPDQLAFERLCGSEPFLTDIRPAGEVVPGYEPGPVLTSGAPMPWERYTGGQRAAIIGGALFEGLAADRDGGRREAGDGRDPHRAVPRRTAASGSVAGIYTASMPVFVVENRALGNVGFCNFYEGT